MVITPRFVSYNFSQGRYGDHVRLIVLHTEQGYENGTASWFNNPAALVSAHYGISLAGGVDQFVSEGDTAWACGVWGVNTGSISIEHEDNRQPDTIVHTDEQYEASAQLVADIARRYGLPITTDTVKGHKQVSSSHPDCPGNLDVNRVIARAQGINAVVAVVAAPVSVAGLIVVDETITVTNSVLRVHNDPSTADSGDFANTPDGMLHDGDLVHIVGYIHGQDPYNDGRDAWLKTLNGLGQSHWIWAGGTSFSAPVPAPTPVLPVPPTPDVPAPVVEPAVTPATPVEGAAQVVSELPGTTPDLTPAPSEPVVGELSSAPGLATLDRPAIITDLATGQPIAHLDTTQPLQIAGTKLVNNTLYLVTDTMVAESLNHGIAVHFFTPVKSVDTITTKHHNPAPTLSDLPKHQSWIARLLHFLTGVKP